MICTIYDPTTGQPLCQFFWSGPVDTAPDHGYLDCPKLLTANDGLEIDEAWVIDGQRVPRTGVPEAETQVLAKVHASALTAIDAQAETLRQKLLTPGAGQVMTYQAKRDEAVRYALDPAPDPVNYLFASAEIGIIGADLAEVIAVYNTAYQRWMQASVAIESVRMAAKTAIKASQTAEEVQAVLDGLDWPTA